MTNQEIFCFGEVLWDLLPRGRFLGGAPLNVAYHLAQLGCTPRVVSAVGTDALGDEALQGMARVGLDTGRVARRPHLPTGTVDVEIDAAGHACYRIAQPVAWDEIDGCPAGAARPAAVVFGTLALRNPGNRAALRTWLAARPAVRVCDLNLRTPFDDLTPLRDLVHGVEVLKLNIDEARRLVPPACARCGAPTLAAELMAEFGARVVCLTCGPDGALIRSGERTYAAPAPPVVVCDTVGAGDAFTAALLAGLLAGGAQTDWMGVLVRACRLGSLVASRHGAQPAYELEELER